MVRLVDFSKYQDPNKKIPDVKITPGDKNQKVAQPEKKSTQDKKSSKNLKVRPALFENKSMDPQIIDQKINEFELRIEKKFNELNERQLKLLRIGVKHELTFENLENYIKTHGKKTKLYKLADYFSESELYEIEKMLKYLYSTGVIGRDQNNWYYWKGKNK